MSFTLDNDIGHPMALIVGGKSKKNNLVSFIGKFDEDKDEELNTSYELLTLKQGKFQPVPDTKKEREVLYIIIQYIYSLQFLTKEMMMIIKILNH